MESVVQISCENFLTSFKGLMSYGEIHSQDSIRMLDHFVDSVQIADDTSSLDTRAEFIYLNPDEQRVRICMNYFDVFVNGRHIQKNKQFEAFLRSMLRPKQFEN